MSHCGPELTAVGLAQIDMDDAQTNLEAKEIVLDLAQMDLDDCEASHA